MNTSFKPGDNVVITPNDTSGTGPTYRGIIIKESYPSVLPKRWIVYVSGYIVELEFSESELKLDSSPMDSSADNFFGVNRAEFDAWASQNIKCECGVDKLGYGNHSDYCPKYKGVE